MKKYIIYYPDNTTTEAEAHTAKELVHLYGLANKSNLGCRISEIANADIKTFLNDLRLVYGTKYGRWYAVGKTDRDYNTGIEPEKFLQLSPIEAIEKYLSAINII